MARAKAKAAELVPDPLLDARHPECRFATLDFETADNGRDSACALALVKVAGGTVIDKLSILIRPPRRTFQFTFIHGITWSDVASQPTFGEHWNAIARFVEDVSFLVAHNASFDRGVLHACCIAAGVTPPHHPFFCTVQLSRKTWSLPRHSLSSVCDHLQIELEHHKAESDAFACARIVQEALVRHGGQPLPWKPLKPPKGAGVMQKDVLDMDSMLLASLRSSRNAP